MKKAISILFFLSLIGLFPFNAEALLIDRGGGLIYDDVLDVTWLQDANYAVSSGYWDALDKTGYSDWSLNHPGTMIWNDAMDWADGLEYYDSVRDVTWSDWRLVAKAPCRLALCSTR